MALVDYSSSSSGDEAPGQYVDQVPDSRKRKRRPPLPKEGSDTATSANGLPPLPSSFHDMYASSTRMTTHDDPSLHGGRKRAVPHVEGNWPSHVYLEWLPSQIEHSTLTSLLSAVQRQSPDMKLETLLTSSLETPLPLHISLSAPLSIATEMKNAFAENLQQRLPAIALPEIKLSDLNWVSNNEGTRWFLVLRCEHPGLDRLLAWSNEVCRELGLEQLYTSSKSKKNRANEEGKRQKLARAEAADSKAEHNGRFHFSIAWTLSAPCTQNDPMVSEQVEEKLRQSKAITVPIDTVKVKVGNVVTSLDLQRGRHEGRGILG